jgi:pimeloyl-ACP methyl ester carboxylesterase
LTWETNFKKNLVSKAILYVLDVHTLHDYTQPLLDLLASLPPNQKVVLVGHSLGGFNLALAIDKYPEKVAVGVFVTAVMPDTTHKPSYVLEQVFQFATSKFEIIYFEAAPNCHSSE